MSQENLAAQIEAVGEKFNKSLTDLQSKFDELGGSQDKLASDQKEQLEKLQKEFGDNAAELHKLQEQASTQSKRLDEMQAKQQELHRAGNATGASKEEYLKEAKHMRLARSNKGESATHLYGDEEASELPSEQEVATFKSAFERYARGKAQDFNQLGKMPEETLAVGSSLFYPSFGMSVPKVMTDRIIGNLFTFGSLRGLALERTISGPGRAVNLMRYDGKTTVKVNNEAQDFEQGDLPKGADISYPIVDYDVTVAVHPDVIDDSAMDVVGFLTNEARMAFGETEAGHHINGTGHNQPHGILQLTTVDRDANAVGKSEASFGQAVAVKTGNATGLGHGTAANDAYAFNPLIAALNSLHGRYRPNATMVMNRVSFAAFAVMRNADGDYLVPADQRVASDGGMRLLGYPVRINDFMPDPAANALAVAIADFNQAYEIANKAVMGMLIDPYSQKPAIEYTFRWRTGGRPADTRAIRFLKCAA